MMMKIPSSFYFFTFVSAALSLLQLFCVTFFSFVYL